MGEAKPSSVCVMYCTHNAEVEFSVIDFKPSLYLCTPMDIKSWKSSETLMYT